MKASSTMRSNSSSRSKETIKLSKTRFNSNAIKNSSVSSSARSKNILSKQYMIPKEKPSESKEPEGVADQIKERIFKLEQELGSVLGVDYHPEVNQRVQTYVPQFEPRALRDLRQIRQSMATKCKKN